MKLRKNVLLMGIFCSILLLAGCGAENDAAEPWQAENDMGGTESGYAGNGDLKDGNSEGGFQEDAGEPRELTVEELRQFTDFVNRIDNNGFLLSQYAQAGEVDLDEVLYNGAGMDMQDLSEAERKAYEGMGYSIETDITHLSAGQIEDFLQEKMGIGLEDVSGGLNWVYLAESDSYVFQHGDTNYCRFVCTGGRQTGEIYEIRCKSGSSSYVSGCVVTLEKTGTDYRFVSNLFAENTDDTRLVRRIDEQCFSVELNDWGGVEFVSLAPDILEDSMQDVSFELWQEGGTVYTFPEAAEGNVRVDDSFVRMDAVAFRDYDKDGYTDVITICTYEWLPWAGTEGQYQEVRVYKGNEKAFRYMDEVSSALNRAQCNQSISQVLAQIEEEEPDFGWLDEDILRQLEIFAEAKSEWVYQDYEPFLFGYTVHDMDGDGRLELLTQVTAGTGLFSENHFYRVNASGDGIEELPQEYYENYAELDIGVSGFKQQALRDMDSSVVYYLASDITKNGYAESLCWDGAYYLKDGCVYSTVYRGVYRLLREDDSVEETYYDTEGNEISAAAWEGLYQSFCEGKEDVAYGISWKDAYSGDVEEASVKEILKSLAELLRERK